jgi:hypothetical protein
MRTIWCVDLLCFVDGTGFRDSRNAPQYAALPRKGQSAVSERQRTSLFNNLGSGRVLGADTQP